MEVCISAAEAYKTGASPPVKIKVKTTVSFHQQAGKVSGPTFKTLPALVGLGLVI